jgi:large subunit ribosomal protein L11
MADPKAKGGKKNKIADIFGLQIPAGQANPSPPVGPALGQRGVNIMDFCKAFNEATSQYESGTPIPVQITVMADRSFTFKTKTPPASYFLKKAAKQKKGSSTPSPTETVAVVTKAQVKEIAEAKMVDLNANDIEAAMKIIEGSARSMGYAVKG